MLRYEINDQTLVLSSGACALAVGACTSNAVGQQWLRKSSIILAAQLQIPDDWTVCITVEHVIYALYKEICIRRKYV